MRVVGGKLFRSLNLHIVYNPRVTTCHNVKIIAHTHIARGLVTQISSQVTFPNPAHDPDVFPLVILDLALFDLA